MNFLPNLRIEPNTPISRNHPRGCFHWATRHTHFPTHAFLPSSKECNTPTSKPFTYSTTSSRKTHLLKPKRVTKLPPPSPRKHVGGGGGGMERMGLVCGVGYWVQGFRCFPWLALNFHMAHGLGLSPSTLQLVQNVGALPMVVKPLYGVLSDALYIGGAHRLPYISFGVFLQMLSWGTLALIPLTGDTFPTQMSCILVGNLGASITEVISDALVVEFSKAQKAGVVQTYASMALAAGGILGNFTGGFLLSRSQEPQMMFFFFASLLALQLALSMTSKEDALHASKTLNRRFALSTVTKKFLKQFSNLIAVVSDAKIIYPLAWIIASISIVPLLSGTMFCFQTQCLNLDPSIIGLSKVVGQLFFLSATFVYNHYLKRIPMRVLIFGVQALYAICLLSDLLLVKQVNLQFGISNKIHVLCLSALAEAAAQFKILPFTVLLTKLCPPGFEGSLFAFFTSALCLSSIISGILGVGLANLLGLSSGHYELLPLGIVLQSLAALIPLSWIAYVPMLQAVEKGAKRTWGKPVKFSRAKTKSL